MRFDALPCAADAVLALRERYCAEMRCQLIFCQIHARAGWTEMFALHADGVLAGFGTKSVSGPWRERPTIIEFFVSPEQRSHVFRLFEALLAKSGARHIETLSNGAMLAHMLHARSHDVASESILFHYNRPYGDVHMEIIEQFRRRGFGACFVQELKRACRALGAIPAARCNPDNLASRYTLQKAGFVPCGHLLMGSIAT